MKPDRKQISLHLIEHLEREELHTSQAAQYLNLNPCYISMAKSEVSWDAMSRKAWERLEEWSNTRDYIKNFKIPEGEEIFRKPEKASTARTIKPELPELKKTTEIISAIIPEPDKNLVATSNSKMPGIKHVKKHYPKKEKHGKSVKLVINQAEIAAIHKRIDSLYGNHDKRITDLFNEISILNQNLNNSLRIMQEHEIRFDKLEIQPAKKGKKPSKGIVVFQRNYYKS